MGAPRSRQPIRSIVLDASALTLASDRQSQLRAQLRRAALKGAQIVTPATTLTESLRGHLRDAELHHLLRSVHVTDVDAGLGRRAGERIGRTHIRGSHSLDAIVAELASSLPRPVVVVTADVGDMRMLADHEVMILDVS